MASAKEGASRIKNKFKGPDVSTVSQLSGSSNLVSHNRFKNVAVRDPVAQLFTVELDLTTSPSLTQSPKRTPPAATSICSHSRIWRLSLVPYSWLRYTYLVLENAAVLAFSVPVTTCNPNLQATTSCFPKMKSSVSLGLAGSKFTKFAPTLFTSAPHQNLRPYAYCINISLLSNPRGHHK